MKKAYYIHNTQSVILAKSKADAIHYLIHEENIKKPIIERNKERDNYNNAEFDLYDFYS